MGALVSYYGHGTDSCNDEELAEAQRKTSEEKLHFFRWVEVQKLPWLSVGINYSNDMTKR